MIALEQIPESRIREAAADVFARAHFTRDRSWFDNLEIPFPDWSPRVWWTLVAVTLAMMVISVLARRIPEGLYSGTRAGGGAGLTSNRDNWLLANELAARGDYVAALHALFAALVSSLARADEVDPHPAKTVGDYARELAARRSVIAAPFREFAAQYERTLYAGSRPDRDAYESIARLAQPLASAASTRR